MSLDYLVFLADTHCGHRAGLLPPEFKTLDGQTYEQNELQVWSWSCLQRGLEFVRSLPRGKVGGVFMGDAIQGNRYLDGLIMPDTDHQVECAMASLLCFKEAVRGPLWVAKGTKSHVHNTERAIALHLDAQRHGNDPLHWWVKLILKGIHVKAAHHCRTGTLPWTKGGGPQRTLVNYQLQHVAAGEIAPDVAVGAHKHEYEQTTTINGMGFVCPPCQFVTEFAHEKCQVEYAFIGLLVLDFKELFFDLPLAKPLIFRPETNEAIEV